MRRSPAAGPSAPQRAFVPPRGFHCSGCGGVFATAEATAAHMEKVAHGAWYRCTGCGQKFVTQQLRVHHEARCAPRGPQSAGVQSPALAAAGTNSSVPTYSARNNTQLPMSLSASLALHRSAAAAFDRCEADASAAQATRDAASADSSRGALRQLRRVDADLADAKRLLNQASRAERSALVDAIRVSIRETDRLALMDGKCHISSLGGNTPDIPNLKSHLRYIDMFTKACECVTLGSLMSTGFIQRIIRADHLLKIQDKLRPLLTVRVSALDASAVRKAAGPSAEAFCGAIDGIVNRYAALKSQTVAELRNEFIHGRLTFDAGVVVGDHIRGDEHVKLKNDLCTTVESQLFDPTTPKEDLEAHTVVSVPRNSKSSLLQAVAKYLSEKHPNLRAFLISYNSSFQAEGIDGEPARMAARFFARVVTSLIGGEANSRWLINRCEKFVPTYEELEHLLIESGAINHGTKLFIAADEFSNAVEYSKNHAGDLVKMAISSILKLHTTNSFVLFSGFGVTDGLMFDSYSGRSKARHFVPMLSMDDRQGPFAPVLISLALMFARYGLNLSAVDAVAYEAAKSSAGVLGRALELCFQPTAKPPPRDALFSFIVNLPWMDTLKNNRQQLQPLVFAGLFHQFLDPSKSGLFSTAVLADSLATLVKTLDEKHMLLALSDTTACVAPLALWVLQCAAFSPIPTGVSVESAARNVLNTFWCEYAQSVSLYHALASQILEDSKTRKGITTTKSKMDACKGSVGEVLVRAACRLRILASDVGASGHNDVATNATTLSSIMEARGHTELRPEHPLSTTMPNLPAIVVDTMLRIDSFPNLVNNDSKDAALERARGQQVLTAITALVDAVYRDCRTQVLCVAIGGANAATDETHITCTFDRLSHQVSLSAVMYEVKYGFKTLQLKSDKVDGAAKGLRIINTLLTTHSTALGPRKEVFPSKIASAELVFIYLGPPKRMPDETKKLAKAVRGAQDVMLSVREESPKKWLSPSFHALLIDEDMVTADADLQCS